MSKHLFLYDPRTNITKETTYQYLAELTGKKISGLPSYKTKKIKVAGCYIVDETLTLKQRKSWYEKEKFENEVWVELKGSEGSFLISNYGRFKKVYKKTTRFLMPFLKKRDGVLEIKVRFNGKYKNYRVSHLVAHHFVEGSKQPGMVLHHKNLIKTDNFSGNLKYITKKELGKKTGQLSKSKAVVQLDKETKEYINEFRSAREAGRQCFISYQSVLDTCNHKQKKNGGFYTFMFLDEYERLDRSEEVEESLHENRNGSLYSFESR